MGAMSELDLIFNEIIADDDLANDRREYSPDDLAKAYALSDEGAHMLYEMIREYFKC